MIAAGISRTPGITRTVCIPVTRRLFIFLFLMTGTRRVFVLANTQTIGIKLIGPPERTVFMLGIGIDEVTLIDPRIL